MAVGIGGGMAVGVGGAHGGGGGGGELVMTGRTMTTIAVMTMMVRGVDCKTSRR